VAADCGAPIIPVANCGSHAQYTMLAGGSVFARCLGLTRFKIHRFPVTIGLLGFLVAFAGWCAGWISWPWMLLGLACAILPNPSRMDITFLAPIQPAQLLTDARGDFGAAAEQVRTRIEQAVKTMAARRATPWE